MKEFDPHTPEASKDKPEIHAVAPAKAEMQYRNTIRVYPGQKLYECDLKTKEIREADVASAFNIEKNAADNKAVMKPNCYYVAATNKTVAAKKMAKFIKAKRLQLIMQMMSPEYVEDLKNIPKPKDLQ